MAPHDIPEEWRPVEGWPYEVSSLGRMRRLTTRGGRILEHPRIVAPKLNKHIGYCFVVFTANGKRLRIYVHRLICTVFHGPPPTEKHQAAHYDGTRNNNAASNLRWATDSENKSDMVRHGTRRQNYRHSKCRIEKETILAIDAAVGTYNGIAKRFGTFPMTVWMIKNRKAYHWAFSDS